MPDFFDLVESMGRWSVDALWLPLGAWTCAAGLALVLDAATPLRRPLARQRLLVAVLVALPLGLALRLAHPLVVPTEAVVLDAFVPATVSTALPTALPVEAPPRPVLPLLVGFSVVLIGLAAVGGFARLVAQHVRLRRWLRALPLVSEADLPAPARTLIARMRGPARVCVVDADVSPFTYGILRPVVVLPARLADDEAAFRLALAHEAAHVAHGDARWHLAARLAAALVAWHPLAHRLIRQAELRREQAADAYVLGHFPVARRQYAHLLLDFGAVPAPAAALAASIHQLKPRVAAMKTILDLRARGFVPALALLLCLTATLSLRAQETNVPVEVEVDVKARPDVYVVVEQMPEYPGGGPALVEHLKSTIQYPDIAKRAGIAGRVIVQFVVDEQGNVGDAKIIRGVGGGCDEEALRVVRTLKFTPGRQAGKAVKVLFTLPISFELPDAPPSPGTPPPPPGTPPPPPPPPDPGSAPQGAALALRVTGLQRTGSGLTGTVVDASGRPLVAANVVVDGTQIGAATDREGRFVLRAVPEGAAALRVSFAGFENLSVPIGDEQMAATAVPEGYVLDGVPNPSSGSTEIRFSVPQTGTARVEVYDALGRRVDVLFDGAAAAGRTYEVVFDGAAHESGVYFYRLTHEGHTMTRTVTLAR